MVSLVSAPVMLRCGEKPVIGDYGDDHSDVVDGDGGAEPTSTDVEASCRNVDAESSEVSHDGTTVDILSERMEAVRLQSDDDAASETTQQPEHDAVEGVVGSAGGCTGPPNGFLQTSQTGEEEPKCVQRSDTEEPSGISSIRSVPAVSLDDADLDTDVDVQSSSVDDDGRRLSDAVETEHVVSRGPTNGVATRPGDGNSPKYIRSSRPEETFPPAQPNRSGITTAQPSYFYQPPMQPVLRYPSRPPVFCPYNPTTDMPWTRPTGPRIHVPETDYWEVVRPTFHDLNAGEPWRLPEELPINFVPTTAVPVLHQNRGEPPSALHPTLTTLQQQAPAQLPELKPEDVLANLPILDDSITNYLDDIDATQNIGGFSDIPPIWPCHRPPVPPVGHPPTQSSATSTSRNCTDIIAQPPAIWPGYTPRTTLIQTHENVTMPPIMITAEPYAVDSHQFLPPIADICSPASSVRTRISEQSSPPASERNSAYDRRSSGIAPSVNGDSDSASVTSHLCSPYSDRNSMELSPSSSAASRISPSPSDQMGPTEDDLSTQPDFEDLFEDTISNPVTTSIINATTSLPGPTVGNEEQVQNAVKRVSQLSSSDLLSQNDDGDSMLHSALIHEEMPYTETLIDRFREFALLGSVINMRNKLDQTPLCLAVITNQPVLVEKLLQLGASANVAIVNYLGPRMPTKRDQPLHFAAGRGLPWLNTLLVLLRSQRDSIDEFNSEGRTALHCAVESHGRGTTTMPVDATRSILLLVENGANLNKPDGKSDKTPLHYAIEKRDVDLVRLLLELAGSPAAIRWSPAGGRCPSLVAAMLSARTGTGNAALHLAVSVRHMPPADKRRLVQLLLSRGADPSAKNGEGQLPREMTHDKEITELLKGRAGYRR